METAVILEALQTGTIEVEGLMPWSSNYTFLIQVCTPDQMLPAVYKPRQGERPLWDFPSGTLCKRERAAYLVSQALGWDLVPPTVLRDGPNGLGSVQLFIENHDPERHYFTFEGDSRHREALQKMVLFDTIINNADRKAGHVLIEEMDQIERLWGIDHGICFHAENKLRTVIWEFAGTSVPSPLIAELKQFQSLLTTNQQGIRTQLAELLLPEELLALQVRLQRLLQQPQFAHPGPGRQYPWPPV